MNEKKFRENIYKETGVNTVERSRGLFQFQKELRTNQTKVKKKTKEIKRNEKKKDNLTEHHRNGRNEIKESQESN